jgi:hypothetical protein
MKKTIITVFACLVLFGFVTSGVMAQTTWTWDPPEKIINTNEAGVIFFDEFVFTNGVLQGCVADECEDLQTEDAAGGGVQSDVLDLDAIVDSVAVPPFALIDPDTVGFWDGSSYVALALEQQPDVPNVDGVFTHIAAGSDGTLYVIFESTDPIEQYILVGTPDPPIEWEEATVRFTPRSLNLGSNGKWVTCKVNAIADHTWDEVDLTKLCIVGINGELITSPVYVDATGPSNTKNSKKMMVKFDRRALADAISANLGLDPKSTKITLAYTDGTLSFYGEDTIKTKPAKVKKPKKK